MITGWRPIETAPQDKPVLGFSHNTCRGNVMATVMCQYDKYHGGHYWALCECGSYVEDDEWEPELWMPLPEPPSGKEDN